MQTDFQGVDQFRLAYRKDCGRTNVRIVVKYRLPLERDGVISSATHSCRNRHDKAMADSYIDTQTYKQTDVQKYSEQTQTENQTGRKIREQESR